jgi:murein DD-endopeptidase MepM/ murein hydrolase activator NlpD
MFKRSIALTISILIILTILPQSAGGSIEDLKEKQQEIEEQINAYREKAEALDNEKDSVQAEINSLDYELNALNLEVDSYELQKKEINMKIAENEQEIANLTEQIEENNEALEKRLRVMYKNGSAGYLEVVLNSDNLVDALTRVDMIQLIVQSDVELLKNIEEQKTKVEEIKVSLQEDRLELTAVINDLAVKQDELIVASRAKESYVTELQSDLDAIKKQEAAMEAESDQIEKDIIAAQREVDYAGGELLWPVPGNYRITSPFGGRYDPISGVWSTHGGTDIAALNGTPIVAANSGVVLMAGWNNSYGNFVLIDHGGGISTLYGHSSKLLVYAGQTVSRGETIALVGSTGYSTGNHLHFEVRINGVRTDPMEYYQ